MPRPAGSSTPSRRGPPPHHPPSAPPAAGPPPQHLAFGPRGRAYVTSGSDGTLRIVSAATGRTLRIVRTAYGSFNLGLAGGLVTVASLYRGTLTELDDDGRVLLRRRVA